MRRVKGQRRNRKTSVRSGRANFDRRKTKAIAGDHLIQCDITGQVCLRSEAKYTWDGLLVSAQNWDPKHPQLTIRVPPEKIAVEDVRPFKCSTEQYLPGVDIPPLPFVQLNPLTIEGI